MGEQAGLHVSANVNLNLLSTLAIIHFDINRVIRGCAAINCPQHMFYCIALCLWDVATENTEEPARKTDGQGETDGDVARPLAWLLADAQVQPMG